MSGPEDYAEHEVHSDMATHAGELVEPRHIDQLRLEIVEEIAAALAYPPFFDFRANALRNRPIDRVKMTEIEQFIGSANFDTIGRSSPSAPETRSFLEHLALRYLEVNPALATTAGRRYLPLLRTRAVALAADTSRRFISHVGGGEKTFGAHRQAASWTAAKHAPRHVANDTEHNSRVLEAAIVPRDRSAASGVRQAPSPSVSSRSGGLSSGVVSPPPPTIQPFSAFAAPAHAAAPADLTDQPTGPLASVLPGARPQSGRQTPMRELPPDLLSLYGDYLGDLEPEAPARPVASVTPPPPAASPPPPRAPHHAAPHAPPPMPTPAAPADARGDQLIFWQLRYQLEAYVRMAARSYGLAGHGGDPASVLDELRRSGFVDEADLRIAEGVFALTDRVTAQGSASTADYRQAMMLYLLYHRSHINA